MKQYLRILKLLLYNNFKNDPLKKKSTRYAIVISVGIGYLFIAAFIVFYVYLMGGAFYALGLFNELIVLILLIGSVPVLIFGVVSLLNNLYFSKDTEFFLSLPVKPHILFAAKFTLVYILEMFLSVALLLPALITAGVIAGQGAVYYMVMLLGILLAPALPLIVAAILTVPLMYIVGFFKNRSTLGSMVALGLFAAVFGVYMYFAFNLQSSMQNVDPELAVSGMKKALNSLSNVFLPFAALAKAATLTQVYGNSADLSVLINLGIFLGFVAALAMISLFTAFLVYTRGAASQIEHKKSKSKTGAAFRIQTAFKSLVIKEFRETLRNSTFAMQCFLGVLLLPLMIVLMSFSFRNAFAAEIDGGAVHLSKYFFMFLMQGICIMMGVSLNIGAATSFSREGKNIYFVKIMPVDYNLQIKARLFLWYLVSAITLILGIIAMAFIFFDVLFLLLSLGFMLTYNYGYVCFALNLDLKNPKLNWTTAVAAVKQNKNAVIPMLLNMAFSTVLFVFPMVLVIFINETLALLIIWPIFYLISAVVAIVFHKALFTGITQKFEALEAPNF